MSSFQIADESDVAPGCLKRVEVNGTALCLARLDDGSFHAIPDACTHEEVSLADGELDGVEIECPAHGSRFNVETGEVAGLPAIVPTTPIPVRVEDGAILVEL